MTKRNRKTPPQKQDDPTNPFSEYGKRSARARNRMVVSDDHPDNPHSITETWIDALEDVDDRGDPEPLARLMESGHPLNDKVRHLLADLYRRRLAKRPGRPRTPAYRASDVETDLAFAHGAVAELIEGGKSVQEALEMVSKARLIDKHLLTISYGGRRGSALRRRFNAEKKKARPAD